MTILRRARRHGQFRCSPETRVGCSPDCRTLGGDSRLGHSTICTLTGRTWSTSQEGAMKMTLSVIKADVGSIGGHTKPSERMLRCVHGGLRDAMARQFIVDGVVTYTGDDIAIIMSHTKGAGAP